MKNTFVLLFVLLLVSTINAAASQNEYKTALLDSAFKDMSCRAEFDINYMNAIIETFPNLSTQLNPRIEKMENDIIQLEMYKNQNDPQNYSKYVQEEFTQNLKDNNMAIKQSFESLKTTSGKSKNETKAALTSLKATYRSLKEGMESCFSIKNHTDLIFNYYNNTLDAYTHKAQMLSDKGINVTNLFDLIERARIEILDPLQNEISTIESAPKLRATLNKYCLFDGCNNGTNFHLAAKFEVMKIGDLFVNISPQAINANLSNEVSEVETALNSANSEITSWGTEDATHEQIKNAWSNIKLAAKGLHDIFMKIRGNETGEE